LKKVPQVEIDQRVKDTAELLGIADLLEKRPHQLSGGQRQRVAVGRALIRKPKIFLFDEPLSNLDALLRERVRHDLKQLFKKIDATVIYVTHDQLEAMTLADRVVVLDRGSIQQVGTPDELYRNPRNRFVASFIGSPSMNIFDTTIDKGVLRIGATGIQTSLSISGAVLAGIRPEAFLHTGPGPGAATISGEVLWIESLGAQFLIGVDVGGLTLNVLSHRHPETETIALHFPLESIHVFEKNSGTNLIHRDHRGAAG
jgi:ABC-type sugar transport system ATPase subunit